MAFKRYPRRSSKYGSRKIEIDGEIFDSKKEARRFQELKLMEAAGEITDLRRQVKYVLIPAQFEPDTIGPKGGVHKGKCLEREVAYYADFTYQKDGETIVEDVKGLRTDVYILKRKLMLWIHGARIKEV